MCGEGCIGKLERGPKAPVLRAIQVKFVEGGHTKCHFHTGEQTFVAIEGQGFVKFQ